MWAWDGVYMKIHLQDGGVEAGRSAGTRRQLQRNAGTRSCWPQSTARVGQLWSAAMQKIRNMVQSQPPESLCVWIKRVAKWQLHSLECKLWSCKQLECEQSASLMICWSNGESWCILGLDTPLWWIHVLQRVKHCWTIKFSIECLSPTYSNTSLHLMIDDFFIIRVIWAHSSAGLAYLC